MGKRYELNIEEQKFILDNYLQISRQQISRQLNISDKIIFRFLNEQGLIQRKTYNTNSKKCKSWSDIELQYLKDNFNVLDSDIIAKNLNKTIESLHYNVRKLGLYKRESNLKSHREYYNNYLKENYNKKSIVEMALELNKSEQNIKRQLIKLKLFVPKSNKVTFSKKDIDFMLLNKDKLSFDEIGNKLNKDRRSISKYFKENNIKRNYIPHTNKPIMILNDEQIQFILNNYIIKSYYDISQELNIPQHYVMQTLRKHNIYLKSNRTRRCQTIPEKIISKILIDNTIQFNTEVLLDHTRYHCDFQIKNSNKIIEVLGDYWHYNPRFYPRKNMDIRQKTKVKKDKIKNRTLVKLGYEILYLWEYDIKNHLDICEKRILKFVNS